MNDAPVREREHTGVTRDSGDRAFSDLLFAEDRSGVRNDERGDRRPPPHPRDRGPRRMSSPPAGARSNVARCR